MKYRYNVKSGVTRIKTNTKKYVLGGIAAITMIGGASVPAFAAYGTQPGFTQAQSQTTCSGAGAFGAFGDKGNVYHDFRGGTNGTQTGINNSNLCGNPQR